METPSSTTRILIADDHRLFREGLKKLLDGVAGFRVAGEAEDGQEAVKMVRQLKPDILLLDLAMPRRPGLEALREINELYPMVHTIVLTAAIQRSQIVEAIQLGARGLVLKGNSLELLVEAIHSVLQGQYWMGRDKVSDLVEVLRGLVRTSGSGVEQNRYGLTPRELEIVATIVYGYSNRDIAQKFSISERTVKHHVSNIFDKLGVSSRLELALFAVNHGLVNQG